jgi:hypothetical protein
VLEQIKAEKSAHWQQIPSVSLKAVLRRMGLAGLVVESPTGTITVEPNKLESLPETQSRVC